MTINEPIGQVSLFSDNVMEEDFDHKPMEIEVSQVKVKEEPMPEDMVEKAKTHIGNAVALADAMLETKKALLDTDEAKNKLNAIQGVGDIIKGVLKFVPGAENPMIQKLDNLEKKIQKLGEKVSEGFDEMKAFISELKFFVRVITPTAVLTKCMRDCLKNPGPEAVENFKDAYRRNSPLKLAYHLISYLEQYSTNPLRRAMDKEKIKTNTTFSKWENIICNMLEQFLVLEAFANGLLHMKTFFNVDVLLSRSNEVYRTINDWRKEYTDTSDNHWDEMKTIFEPYMTKSTNLNNQQKAKEIKEKLDTYMTTDSFYVFVFNDCRWNDKYNYHCPNESTQIIGSWNKGKCNAFIYRSRNAHKKTAEEHKKVQAEVDSCKSGKLRYPGTLKDICNDQLVKKRILQNSGLVLLIKKDQNVAVESSNSPKNQWGPGGWNTVNMGLGLLIIQLATEPYFLCAAFD